ncbi:LacI family DNA-binding transcriptional regulator [Sphingobium sp. Sx8-8]|uniref:LacI family DNA-binding transcriptional regulator n=1 Tax=Sphingobium sp. Sx8-8 TaxID=2933617 RepID=UPI001F59F46E|nr:LacI family DNA-binding transcriptional regulator [Sphingobium sp. Sx8-8]
MKKTTRPVTLADIGASIGMSAKTVSRVVNRDPNVSQATRRRVEAAIAATGFRPNLAARSLAADRSFLVGCFLVNTANFYYAELVRGAARACRRYGYHLVLEELDLQESVTDYYREHMSNIGHHGFLLAPPFCDDAALLDMLDEDGHRYVRVSPATQPGRAPSVYADDAGGVAALAEHLWQLGHRRFGIVSGPSGHLASAVRSHSFMESLYRLGCLPSDILSVEPDCWNPVVTGGRGAAIRMLGTGERPTAIFCYNDELAAGFIGYARDIGLSIPGDLAVAGFDDSEGARLIWPPLTTVHQPIVEMAERAIERLVTPQSAGDPSLMCGVELKIRGSTDPGAMSDPA